MSASGNVPLVLVIDDSVDQQDLVRDQLGPHVHTIAATDGLDGYRLACAQRPSAIVLDVVMPLADGWSVLRKLRSNPATSAIPIIVVTGLPPEAIAEDVNVLGVRTLLQKPYDFKDLRTAVHRAVNPA